MGRALWVSDVRTFEHVGWCMFALITDWAGVGINKTTFASLASNL